MLKMNFLVARNFTKKFISAKKNFRSFKHRKISLRTFKKKIEVNRFSSFPPIHITAKSFFKKHHFELFAFKVSSSVQGPQRGARLGAL